MRVAVEPEALAEWSADARRTADHLGASLGALDSAIRPLTGAWRGEAAAGFDRHQRQWQDAAARLIATLSELILLVDTAHGNYVAAASTNIRIWSGDHGSSSGPAVVHAMSAGRGTRGITVETDDIRATVAVLVTAADTLAAAWEQLAAALAGTGAMAGDDEPGAGFGRDHDAMAATAWQGWRSAAVLLDAVAGGLAATGNNILRAEGDSTAGARGVPDLITAAAVPVPRPGAPPGAVGDNGNRAVVPPLAWYWPAADPLRLRTAATAWRNSATGLRDVTDRATAAVTGLVTANPDPALQQMRTFTDRVLSDDPTAGLMGVLALACVRIAGACDDLADATDRTRGLMREAVTTFFAGEEWYHPVATVLDAVITRGAAKIVALGGDLALLDLRLSEIHDDHARFVQLLRHELAPTAADRLARLATALVPPTPLTADTCAVTSPAGTTGSPAPEAGREALIAEVVAAGHKINAAEVLHIARAPDGRVVWLERGNQKAGLSHILNAMRVKNFTDRGVAPSDIPGLALRAVTEGSPLGRVGRGGVVYQVDLGQGRHENIVVVVSSNGFIVTARPLNANEILKPW